MSKSMADIGMETKLSGSHTLANAAPPKDNKGPFLNIATKIRSSCPDGMDSGKAKSKNAKRGKLLKALTLPADASAPSTSDNSPKEDLGPRTTQILPRTSQYEKHPLLQEKSASGLSELELFLLEREKTLNPKPFPPKEKSDDISRPTNKLKLEPRGAHCERHALLKKTPSGMSELELFLQEKNKECEKRERKSKKKLKETKSVGGSAEIPPHKRLWIKKGISVEKAKSFERTACLEKTKCIDQGTNVSRARSLEEEASLRDVRLSALTKHKSLSIGGYDNNPNPDTSNTNNSNMEPSESPNIVLDIPVTMEADPPVGLELVNNSNDDKTLTGSVQDYNNSEGSSRGKRKLLDLALSPSLEWKEENQQFVVVVQSPVSPLEEKPDNLLICVEHRAGSDSEFPTPMVSQEKPKKYVHPSVIDSDPDSEGMVCMDELEPIDFGMSSPEPSPAKTQVEKQSEKEPLIINEMIKSEVEEAQEALQRVIPVDVEAIHERRRQLSIKRASLGQLEPRVDQYEQHILLEKRDDEGKTQIDRFLEEKLREREEQMEQEKLLRVDSNDASNEPNEGGMKPKASIKRVHFEKSGAGQEIEELGKIDIEADPASNNSSAKSGKRRGSKNKSNKGKEGEPEEEKLLNGDSDDREKDQNPGGEIEENKKCCCIS